MKQKYIFYLEILLFVVIITFVYFFTLWLFTYLFFESGFFSNEFIGAFMGALFAFLFIRLSDALGRLYERQKQNYNALVRFEQEGNTYFNLISANVFVIEDFLGVTKKIIDKNEPAIYFNVLHEFALNKEILLDFSNLDLINKAFSFEAGIEQMNHSIASFNRFYSDIKTAFIGKNINFDTYQLNVATLKDKAEELSEFLVGLESECKELVAITRLLIKEKPFFAKITHFFLAKRILESIKKGIPNEIKKLEQEMEMAQKESKEKIASILNKRNQGN